MTGARVVLLLVAVLLQPACRCRSDVGRDHASVAGAAEEARAFWLDVLAGRHESAEARLAGGPEIRAAFLAWSRIADEPIEEATLGREVEAAVRRLEERWREIRRGEDLPEGLDAVALERADTIYCKKMILGPDVSYVQHVILTAEGVGPETPHVAGAVRVGAGGWKIMWLP